MGRLKNGRGCGLCDEKKTSPGVVRGGDQGLRALCTLFMLPGQRYLLVYGVFRSKNFWVLVTVAVCFYLTISV